MEHKSGGKYLQELQLDSLSTTQGKLFFFKYVQII